MRKRPFTLEINKHRETDYLTVEKQKATPKYSRKTDNNKLSPSKDHKLSDKPKRGKTRNRSPMQNHRKQQTLKKNSPLVRSPAMSDAYQSDTWEKASRDGKATSDESSCGMYSEKQLSGQASPRKTKKNRENLRRKSSPRSPTGSRNRRRSVSAEDPNKPSSLPGSLPRRRSSMQTKGLDPEDAQKYLSTSRLSPYR